MKIISEILSRVSPEEKSDKKIVCLPDSFILVGIVLPLILPQLCMVDILRTPLALPLEAACPSSHCCLAQKLHVSML